MPTSTVPVNTNELALGMYVSRLDRPWIQTPFLFQGFPIRTARELEQLREYCDFVFVDTEKGVVPESKKKRRGKKKEARNSSRVNGKKQSNGASPTGGEKQSRTRVGRLLRRIARPSFMSRERTDSESVMNPVPLREEIRPARDIHIGAERVMADVLDTVNKGQTIDAAIVRDVVEPMIDSVLRNVNALAWIVRLQKTDDHTYQTSVATAVYALVFGRHLGLDRDDLRTLGTGGLLLDIGMLRVPEDILKKEAALTEWERDEMRKHVDFGVDVLKRSGNFSNDVLNLVWTHHERFNGTGYPRALNDAEIPVFGRIAGIVSAYNAMISPRPYSKARSTYEAMRQLNRLADVEFQAEMVEQFIQAIGIFPTGTLVELSNGEVGVVVAQNKVRRLRPIVMVILDRNKKPLSDFKRVDLREIAVDVPTGKSLYITEGLDPGTYGIDPSEYYL